MSVKSTFYDIELTDGTVASLTLNYKGLYMLRGKQKKTYDAYVRAQAKDKKNFEDLDNATIIYAAYCCANLYVSNDDFLDFEGFLDVMPADRAIISDCIESLLVPSKKKERLQKHLTKQPKA